MRAAGTCVHVTFSNQRNYGLLQQASRPESRLSILAPAPRRATPCRGRQSILLLRGFQNLFSDFETVEMAGNGEDRRLRSSKGARGVCTIVVTGSSQSQCGNRDWGGPVTVPASNWVPHCRRNWVPFSAALPGSMRAKLGASPCGIAGATAGKIGCQSARQCGATCTCCCMSCTSCACHVHVSRKQSRA